MSSAKRDAGMALAVEGVSAEWKAEAMRAIEDAARKYAVFTSDDVWRDGLAKPDPGSPKALGPLMRRAEKLKLITPTKDFKQTTQTTRNAAPVRVWKSCIHNPDPSCGGII